jgi:hypothetical protein
VVAAGVLAAVLAACGGGSSPSKPAIATTPPAATPSPSASPGSEPDFFEAFDNNDNDWPTLSDRDGTKIAIVGGEYRTTLPAGSIRYIRPAALAQRADVRHSVSITAKVRVLASQTWAAGVACRLSAPEQQYYLGRVFDNGTSALVRRVKGRGDRILRSSRANPIKLVEGQPIQLVLLCGETNGTMSLTLTVNGQVAVQADDPDPLPDNPPGLYVVAGLNTPTSTLAFDDILVSRYTP